MIDTARVLDASAIIAYLEQEPGYGVVGRALASTPFVSTVNLAEAYTKAVVRGVDLPPVATWLTSLGLRTVPFSDEDAERAALLLPATHVFGLSLGNRACLALGRRLSVPVMTADRAWANLSVGVAVEVIR